MKNLGRMVYNKIFYGRWSDCAHQGSKTQRGDSLFCDGCGTEL